jgi:type I restriction enzyme M protein
MSLVSNPGQNCMLRAVVRLPDVTFKPNKINVRASVLYLVRREHPDVDFEANYDVTFIDVNSLGYHGSGEPIRGFNEDDLMHQIEQYVHGSPSDKKHKAEHWRAFTAPVGAIVSDKTHRLDLKYWDPDVLSTIKDLAVQNFPSIGELAIKKPHRGKSPPAENYVDEKDGYAHVIKAGTNISKYGEVIVTGDFIEKNLFEEMSKVHVQDGDLLVSSTGDGTLGKCAVYRGNKPSIADGHVTIVRLDQSKAYPEYVCDYLRFGFGALQIRRLFTGSTGLVELTADQLETVRVELPDKIEAQMAASAEWRGIELHYRGAIDDAEKQFTESRAKFLQFSSQGPSLAATVPEAVDAEDE